MAGKVRVHELAKELGVTVKQLMLLIAEQGEFARSGSSTLEAPVARRLREAHAGHSGSQPYGEGEKVVAVKPLQAKSQSDDRQKPPKKRGEASKAGRRNAGRTNTTDGAAQRRLITQYCVGCKSRKSTKRL